MSKKWGKRGCQAQKCVISTEEHTRISREVFQEKGRQGNKANNLWKTFDTDIKN